MIKRIKSIGRCKFWRILRNGASIAIDGLAPSAKSSSGVMRALWKTNNQRWKFETMPWLDNMPRKMHLKHQTINILSSALQLRHQWWKTARAACWRINLRSALACKQLVDECRRSPSLGSTRPPVLLYLVQLCSTRLRPRWPECYSRELSKRLRDQRELRKDRSLEV